MNSTQIGGSQEKIKLLVIPSAYPESNNDIKGVFVLDYLKCVEKYCDIKVLRATIETSKPALETVSTYGYSTINFRARTPARLPDSKVLSYANMVLASSGLMQELENFKPDLIHVHGSTMHGLLAKRIARKLGIPYVVSEHTGPYSKISGHPVFKRMSKRVIEASARLFSVSFDLESQILKAGIKPQSKAVTFNPVDTDLFKPGKPSNEFVFVGRYEPYKGAMRVLKAFHQIADRLTDWKLKLIGGGKELQEMQLYTQENGLEDRVDVLGQMNKKEISEHLGDAGVFVFPSEHETFGIVIAEGMACGLPVVVGNKTAPKEFVNTTHGQLVEPTDISAIAGAMLQVARSKNEFNSELIRSHIVSKFGFNAFGETLYNHYSQIIGS